MVTHGFRNQTNVPAQNHNCNANLSAGSGLLGGRYRLCGPALLKRFLQPIRDLSAHRPKRVFRRTLDLLVQQRVKATTKFLRVIFFILGHLDLLTVTAIRGNCAEMSDDSVVRVIGAYFSRFRARLCQSAR
jgi:hypothetical protein